MLGAETTHPIVQDPLSLPFKVNASGVSRPLRVSGETFDTDELGRLTFFRMPVGRPSFWRGECRSTNGSFGLRLICEVENDAPPGRDHIACVVALRRLHLPDAKKAAPLVNRRLREMRSPVSVNAEELVLSSIHLPPHPLRDARMEIGFRAYSAPSLSFTVVLAYGLPTSIRIDTAS
jgi:hypothetical protein